MPSISFNKDTSGRAISIVRGGGDDGKICYLHEGDSKAQKKTIDKSRYSKMIKMKPLERTKMFIRLEEALNKNLPVESLSESPEIKKIYESILKDVYSSTSVELDDDGLMELLPSCEPDKRQCWYVAGSSGSGKSFIARQIISSYHKLYPNRGCYLVSKLEQDDTLDALDFLKRIDYNTFVDEYPSIDEFKDCCICFDDYDCIDGKPGKVLEQLINDIAITGRHSNTTMLCLSHYTTNYKKTRLLLMEATNIVVYPQSTSLSALKYLLKAHVGVDDENVKDIKKLGSRWVMYSKHYPQYMVWQKGCMLLHQ